MTKTLLVVATVLALIIGTYFADKATRVKTSVSGVTNKAGGNPDDQKAGEVAPDLTLKDLNGADVSLSDYKGKVVLVNFWATWCEPCRVEIPWLIDLQKKYGPQGLQIVGITKEDGDEKTITDFTKKMGVNYTILVGTSNV